MSERVARVNPDQLHPTPGYHHITIVGFTGQLIEIDVTAALTDAPR